MNVLSELTTLAMHRPRPDAPLETVASWYAAKARLHELLADQGGPDAATENGYAALAQAHADRLLQRATSTECLRTGRPTHFHHHRSRIRRNFTIQFSRDTV